MSERLKQYHSRGLLSETHLAPHVLDDFATWLRDSQTWNAETIALLFGTVTNGVAEVQAFKPVPLPKQLGGSPNISDRLGEALDEYQREPAKTPLQLMGWCCLRPVEDLRQLGAELKFHNQRFRRSTDLLLVLRALGPQVVSARLYARSCDLPLSALHHRAAPVVLPDAILSINAAPATLSGSIDGDLYLNTYRVSNELQAADEHGPRLADLLRPSALKQRLRITNPNKILRLIAAASFLAAAAASVVVMHSYRPISDTSEQGRAVSTFSNEELRMRVEQRKNGILVGWNRDLPTVQTATGGTLQIKDGAQTHTVKLEPLDVANGSILYTPSTSAVNFHLTVFGSDGSTKMEATQEFDRPEPLPAIAANRPTATAKVPPGNDKNRPQPAESAEANSNRSPAQEQKTQPQAAVSAQLANREADREFSKAKLREVTAKQSAITGGRSLRAYTPPRPEKTVRPNLAVFNRSQLSGLSRIEVQVDVDESGNVMAARPLNVDQDVSYPVMAAVLSAARQWVFDPAQNGGRNVPARHVIVFRFAGS